MPNIVFALFAIVAALSGAMAQSPEHCFLTDFSTTQNPFGLWSLGRRGGSIANPGPFAILDTPQFGGWYNGGTFPEVSPGAGNVMTFHPSPTEEAVIRYTAATNQLAVIVATTRDYYPGQTGVAHEVVLRHGDTTVSGPHNSKADVNINTQVVMLAGETIELALNSLNSVYGRVIPTLCVTVEPYPTHDPAVAAFCDDIASQCTALDAECTTIRNGQGPVIGSGSMSNQAGNGGVGEQTGGVTLSGNSVVVTATGVLSCGPNCPTTGPNGNGGSGLLLPGASRWSLLARIGAGPWQFVGAGPTTLTGTGALTFGFNDGNFNDNTGSWAITIRDDITKVADDCDTSVAACNDVEADCRDKALNCPLV